MDFYELADNEFEEIVRLRRHFHEFPECGPDEQLETMAFIEKELDGLKIRMSLVRFQPVARKLLTCSEAFFLPKSIYYNDLASHFTYH